MTPSPIPAVEICGLSRNFLAKPVLKNVDLCLQRGERVVLRGANGTGKTTLLRILSTLLAPSSGSVRLNGISVEPNSKLVRRQFGWAPSVDSGFFLRLTGYDNLLFFGRLKGCSAAEVRNSLGPLGDLPPFAEALRTPYSLCSAGMKQALTLSRAMLGTPSLLFLDEPTRSLDTDTARDFFEILRRQHGDKTIFFSSHQPHLEESFATRTVTLREGTVA